MVFQAQVKPKKEVSLLDLDDCESHSFINGKQVLHLDFCLVDGLKLVLGRSI